MDYSKINLGRSVPVLRHEIGAKIDEIHKIGCTIVGINENEDATFIIFYRQADKD